MTLRRHIKSFITVQTEKTMISYKNQPKSCRHCTQLLHPGKKCTQNKKSAKNNSASFCETGTTGATFAEVLSQPPPVTQNSHHVESDNKQLEQQQKNTRPRSSSSPEIKSPPRNKTVQQQNESDGQDSTQDSEMESVSSVQLSDSEAEPDSNDIGKWIARFSKQRRKITKKYCKDIERGKQL